MRTFDDYMAERMKDPAFAREWERLKEEDDLFADLMEAGNDQYLEKIDRGFEQLRAGRCQTHELIEADDSDL